MYNLLVKWQLPALVSAVRNKTWLVAAQGGRYVIQISILKQDKCSGNEVKRISAMKAVDFPPGLAGMVCVKPRGALLLGRQGCLQQQCLACCLPQPEENWEMWARRGLLTQEHMVSWLICGAWVCLGNRWIHRLCELVTDCSPTGKTELIACYP